MSRTTQGILAIFALAVVGALVAAIVISGPGGGERGKGGGKEGKPPAAFTISGIEGQTIMLQGPGGRLSSVQVDTSTVVRRGKDVITLADLRVGDKVRVLPAPDGQSGMRLQSVQVQVPGKEEDDDD